MTAKKASAAAPIDTTATEMPPPDEAPADEFEVGDTDPGTGTIDGPDADVDATLPDGPDDDDVAIVGELVPADDPAMAAHRAIAAAAEAAITSPGMPGRDEFMALAMHARMLAESNLAPPALRNKPADAMIVLLTGRDLGIPMTAATRKIQVVDGQPTLAPELQHALIRRQGVGLVKKVKGSCAAWAGAWAVGPDGQPINPEPQYYTWADAQDAQLAGIECMPTEDGARIIHTEACRRGPKGADCWRQGQRIACKDNWRHYPARMVWARVLGFEIRDTFPDVGLGLYSPDELGAITDDEGRAIDARTVELPPGFGRGATPAGRQAAAEQAAGSLAPADELADLELRVAALPEEQRAELKARWAVNDRLRGVKLSTVPVGALQLVKAMVGGFEQIAKRTVEGWDPDEAKAVVIAQRAGEPAPDADDTAPTGPGTDSTAPEPSDDHAATSTGDVGADPTDGSDQ